MSRSNNASYSKMHALALFFDTTSIDKLAKIYAIVTFHSMHTPTNIHLTLHEHIQSIFYGH